MNNVQSPNARLLCDHCHGHGYEDTAAGKVACGECNPKDSSEVASNDQEMSEVSTGQQSSEVVSNHQEMSGELQ